MTSLSLSRYPDMRKSNLSPVRSVPLPIASRSPSPSRSPRTLFWLWFTFANALRIVESIYMVVLAKIRRCKPFCIRRRADQRKRASQSRHKRASQSRNKRAYKSRPYQWLLLSGFVGVHLAVERSVIPDNCPTNVMKDMLESEV